MINESLKDYEPSGAKIIANKEKDSQKCDVHIEGKGLEVLFAFSSIVRALHSEIPVENLTNAFEIGCGYHDGEMENEENKE